jgi:hypothetical protein
VNGYAKSCWTTENWDTCDDGRICELQYNIYNIIPNNISPYNILSSIMFIFIILFIICYFKIRWLLRDLMGLNSQFVATENGET